MCTLLSIALILLALVVVALIRELRGVRHGLNLTADRLRVADRVSRGGEAVSDPQPWPIRLTGARTRALPREFDAPTSPGASEQGRDG